MSTLTIELPEILAQQVEQCGLSPQRLQQLFVGWMQSYLQRSDTAVANQTVSPPATTTTTVVEDQKHLTNRLQLESTEGKPYRYPTVLMPASSLDVWLNLVPEGYEGDALTDTETLYDEV
jgi:hypothetical protein